MNNNFIVLPEKKKESPKISKLYTFLYMMVHGIIPFVLGVLSFILMCAIIVSGFMFSTAIDIFIACDFGLLFLWGLSSFALSTLRKTTTKRLDKWVEDENTRLNNHYELAVKWFQSWSLEQIVETMSKLEVHPDIFTRCVEHVIPRDYDEYPNRPIYAVAHGHRDIEVGNYKVTVVEWDDTSKIYSIRIPVKNILMLNIPTTNKYMLWKSLYEQFNEHVRVGYDELTDEIVLRNPDVDGEVYLPQSLLKRMFGNDWGEWFLANVDPKKYKVLTGNLNDVKVRYDSEIGYVKFECGYPSTMNANLEDERKRAIENGWTLDGASHIGTLWIESLTKTTDKHVLTMEIMEDGVDENVKVRVTKKNKWEEY